MSHLSKFCMSRMMGVEFCLVPNIGQWPAGVSSSSLMYILYTMLGVCGKWAWCS